MSSAQEGSVASDAPRSDSQGEGSADLEMPARPDTLAGADAIGPAGSGKLPQKRVTGAAGADPASEAPPNGSRSSEPPPTSSNGKFLPLQLSPEDDIDDCESTSGLRELSSALLASFFCCGGEPVGSSGGQVHAESPGAISRTAFSFLPLDRSLPTILSGEVLAMTPNKVFPGRRQWRDER